MALFHSFSWLSNTPLCTYICIFWTHSSAAGHFSCLHILAMVNAAAVNIGMRVRVRVCVRARVCACVCALTCAHAQSLQSCPTCDPMDRSPPGSSVHGILQARLLEWVLMPSFRGSSRPRDGTCLSCIAGTFFTILTTRIMQSDGNNICKWT